MKYMHLKISDILLLEPDIFRDERGFFYEGFNQKEFDKILGKKISFVQDNYSNSKKNTLRGLHYQIPPKEQGKLVQVLQGEIFDVVDIIVVANARLTDACIVDQDINAAAIFQGLGRHRLDLSGHRHIGG